MDIISIKASDLKVGDAVRMNSVSSLGVDPSRGEGPTWHRVQSVGFIAGDAVATVDGIDDALVVPFDFNLTVRRLALLPAVR